MATLNLFFSANDLDRWRHRRGLIGRLRQRLGRPARLSGQSRVFVNLTAGLEALGVPFRVNDTDYARRHPDTLCCLIGRRRLMADWALTNPLLIGPCVYDHPLDEPRLLNRWPVRRLLVPGEWMRRMCAPAWGDQVHAWPVGIDTAYWMPRGADTARDIDVLVYDKILWDRPEKVPAVLAPVTAALSQRGLRHVVLRYGRYVPEEFRDLLARSRSMVFLCEHETQGLAYQEALASGVPVLAWDAGSPWLDPHYYPHRVVFAPVTSVPYWDTRCGLRFSDVSAFGAAWDTFDDQRRAGLFDPRAFVVETLSLSHSAVAFVAHADAASGGADQTPSVAQ